MTVGERLQAYRKQNNLSQEDLAKQLLLTRQTISLWETDQTMPTVENLMRLKDIFGVSIDDILTDNSSENQDTPTPHETYTFKYTKEDLNTVFKHIYKKSSSKIVSIVIFVIALVLIVISNDAPTFVMGLLSGIFILCLICFIIAGIQLRKQKNALQEKALQNTYIYEIFDTYIKVTVISECNTHSENYIYPQNINQFWDTDTLFFFEYETQVYTLQKSALPESARFYSFFQKAKPVQVQKDSVMFLKHLANLFFVLSFFALPASAMLIFRDDSVASVEQMWKMYLLLPIPITSLVLGILLKIKTKRGTKNIVIGIIISVLLLMYGSFSFIFADKIDTSYEIVKEVEQKVNIDLPGSGQVSTQRGFDGQDDSELSYEYISQIQYTDEEVANFEAALSEDSRWTTELPTMYSGLLSPIHSQIDADYYLLYNLDTAEYNAYPAESGTYRFIYITYDSEDNYMNLTEYKKKIVLPQ